MTHPKNPDTAEKEAWLQEAITAVQKDEHTCHSAHIAFDVPHHTLYSHIKENRKPHNLAHEKIKSLPMWKKKS